MTKFRDVSTEERNKDADAGRALPDGSFPIDNCGDLKNAIQAIGRAKDPGKAKAHIRKRKKALGCPDVELPDSIKAAALTGLKRICPGCGQECEFDALDGWVAPDGSLGHDDYSTHGDHLPPPARGEIKAGIFTDELEKRLGPLSPDTPDAKVRDYAPDVADSMAEDEPIARNTPDDPSEVEVTNAGFAVQAADTGRVLLIQRSLDQDDEPAVRGTWEFPGGGLEEGETPEEAARREFCEETGLPVPSGEITGGWRSPDGIYQGFVFTTPVETDAFPELNPDLAAAEMVNPDDPERRNPDVSAWFTLDQIWNLGPALRPECYGTDWTQFTGGVMTEQVAPGAAQMSLEEPRYLTEEEVRRAAQDPEFAEGLLDDLVLVDPEGGEPIALRDWLATNAPMSGDGLADLAEAEDPEELEPPVDDGYIPWHGVLTVEDAKSGDGRGMTRMRRRPLPLPMGWQKTSAPGHDGTVTTMRIDSMVRVGREVRAAGVVLPTPEADEMLGTVAHFPRFGVSVDADDVQLAFDDEEGTDWYEGARICSASVLPIPAFYQAWVSLGEAPEGFLDGEELEEDVWENDQQALVAAAMVGDRDASVALGLEVFKRGPGWITHPEETRRLWNYWVHGEGAQEIGWGTPGDFNRCRTLVGEKIAKNSPEDMRFLNQICAKWHHDAKGIWPGQEASSEPTVVQPPTDWAPINVAPLEVREALVAAAGLVAPAAWFEDPEFSVDDGRMFCDADGNWGCPMTITEEGEVYGHLAVRGVCHTASAAMGVKCREVPFSKTGYAYFLLGQVLTDEGPVSTGSLTIGGGHADVRLGMAEAMAHYDNASTVFADVNVGDDAFGIWFHGWIRPGTPPEMVVAARASKPSGDWRQLGRRRDDLELIAALAVNSPGYPVVRSRIAAGGEVVALVAAGVVQPTAPEVASSGVDIKELAAAVVDEQIRAQREQAELLARFE